MPRPRREKTLADYVVIAISPALIMTLVGSLVFFLLEASYAGQYAVRMRWIMFWFVFGSVLVARIAIEEGVDHARLFGLALAGATGLGAMRFVDAVIVAWVLLAVVWWCSWKLTWDCTLIDDSEDASGEGLLEAAGLAGGENSNDRAEAAANLAEPLAGFDKSASSSGHSPAPAPELSPKNRKPHSPGLCVVYFSLAALPLFGVGQLLIPAEDAAARARAFGFLAVYVASALGLLLTTSFLGLRRYLRQRKLQMPAAMTASWIGMGTALVIVLLLLAMLLPRPQADYTLTALVDKLDSQVRQASKAALVHGDQADGEGRRIGQQDQKSDKPGEGQPQEQKADAASDKQTSSKAHGEGKVRRDDKQGANSDRDGRSQGKSDRTDRKTSQANGKDGQAGQKNDDSKKTGDGRRAGDGQRVAEQKAPDHARADPQKTPPGSSSPPSPDSLLAQLAPLLKWAIYGTLAVAGLYLLIRHWQRLIHLLASLWAELLSLFGSRPDQVHGGGAADPPPAPPRPFASYEDPFFSGTARRLPPAQIVRYTFEALEAWSREQVVARGSEQTPLEFAHEIGRRIPTLARDVSETAQLYARVAYARHNPSQESLEVLERLWHRMQSAARTPVNVD